MASERVQRTIERLLDEAEDAISRSDWPVVRDRVQNVIALDHENPDALAFLEASGFALGSPGASQPVQPPPAPAPARISDQPTAFANGRYQVKRFLGEGGKKRVYLALDTLLDREVAFALIKTGGGQTIPPANAYSGKPRPWGGWGPIPTS